MIKSGSENWTTLLNSFARLIGVGLIMVSLTYKKSLRSNEEFGGQKCQEVEIRQIHFCP